jgi:hypothetical protein
VSLDRFELLELRRDGSVQTYHAREISTARPVQVHLFTGGTGESAELLRMVPKLPESERRRVLDRGESQGLPYIVTDRLAGYVDFREWVTVNSRPSSGTVAPRSPVRPPTVDEQFFQLFDSAPPAFPAAPAKGLTSTITMTTPTADPVQLEQPIAPSLLSGSIEIEALQPRRGFLPTAAKSLLWLVLGVLTALAFLAGLAAFFAFRPR